MLYTLNFSANGNTINSTFLDPNGPIQMNSAVLDGRLFGGDSHDEAIASGAEVTAPSTPVPDHGSTLVLLGVALAGLGYVGGKFQARKTLDAAQR